MTQIVIPSWFFVVLAIYLGVIAIENVLKVIIFILEHRLKKQARKTQDEIQTMLSSMKDSYERTNQSDS